jgi:hypothetical protein
MIKYNIVKCCYDKILVNVAAYVMLQRMVINIIKYIKNIIFHRKWRIISIDFMDLSWLCVWVCVSVCVCVCVCVCAALVSSKQETEVGVKLAQDVALPP